MLRIIARILSGLLTFLGAIGKWGGHVMDFFGFPDFWHQHLLPLIQKFGLDNAAGAFLAVGVIIFLCTFFFTKTKNTSAQISSEPINPLELQFPIEANQANKISPYKQSSRLLISGEPKPKEKKVFHDFSLAVTNTSETTTTRSSHVRIQAINPLIAGGVIDSYLMLFRGGQEPEETETDIRPKGDILFYLGHGWDEPDNSIPVFPKIVTREQYEATMTLYKENKFVLYTSNQKWFLLPNNNIRFLMTLYADDLPCKEYIATINVKDRLEVFIKPKRA